MESVQPRLNSFPPQAVCSALVMLCHMLYVYPGPVALSALTGILYCFSASISPLTHDDRMVHDVHQLRLCLAPSRALKADLLIMPAVLISESGLSPLHDRITAIGDLTRSMGSSNDSRICPHHVTVCQIDSSLTQKVATNHQSAGASCQISSLPTRRQFYLCERIAPICFSSPFPQVAHKMYG